MSLKGARVFLPPVGVCVAEEALARIPDGIIPLCSFQYSQVGLPLEVMGLSRISMRVFIIPLYAKDLGAKILEIALITAIFPLVHAIVSVPMRIVSEKYCHIRFILLGYFITAFSSFLIFLATKPNQILSFYAISGFGVVAIWPGLVSFVIDISKDNIMGKN